jgi:uncharacterized repeat protein (TIGR03803 family)
MLNLSGIIKLNPLKMICLGCALSIALPLVASAQTFKVLASFDGTDANQPYTGLVQGVNGNLYGTSLFGGSSGDCGFGCGTVFQINSTGNLTMLYSFCAQTGCTDGATPRAALSLAMDGSFYGTTTERGTSNNCLGGCGTVFRIAPSGQLTTLHNFCLQTGCPDGFFPTAKLVLGTDGNYYGTTQGGGNSTNCNGGGCGTVFEINASGQLTTLYSFCQQSGCPDGLSPRAALVQGTDGNLYGTTYFGGRNSNFVCDPNNTGCGTIFRITKAGKFLTVYSFCAQSGCADGANSSAELIQGFDGNFYGTTYYGGGNNCFADCGTVFKITPKGALTTLHSFCETDCADGFGLYAGLVQATDGSLYGTAAFGGANLNGTLFAVTTKGKLTTLYSFCAQTGCPDGNFPSDELVQGTNGSFYGTTSEGGSNGTGSGTVFMLSTGMGPFVSFVNGAGNVGTEVGVLGQGLKGTTAVSFNGTAAKFAVQSNTYLVALVPNGATSGLVTVTTPKGQLKSNKRFQVLP